MSNDSDLLQPGDLVRLKAAPDRTGPILAALVPVAGKGRFLVFHSTGDQREYFEDQLELVGRPQTRDVDLEALSEGRLFPVDEFRARVTALRLAHPQVDTLYALHAARVRFIPFQFKPVLRFLRADRPRLLIADEVGVGKTIEAGLILRELQSRQELQRVLILCPKALVRKWRDEMRRFDEEFRVLTSQSLTYCLTEAAVEEWPSEYARAIVHLELFRMDDYLDGKEGKYPKPGLRQLAPPPQFDLIIVDEAHHLRTPGTNSHELATFLCENAEAVVFLTATPIQTVSQNLFTLLNLLRPDVFLDPRTFDDMMEPNRHLNDAIRLVRGANSEPEWKNLGAFALAEAAATVWGRTIGVHDPRFAHWLTRFTGPATWTDQDRVQCIRDLEEIHTLAHIVNRTRRRDIGRFTLREPHTLSVPFTAQQEQFYLALLDFHHKVLEQRYDPIVIRLIMDIVERQAASCLPAVAAALPHYFRSGRFRGADLTDDPEFDDIEIQVPPDLVEHARRLFGMAAELPKTDPKLDSLRDVVTKTLESDGPGKVLVFSFFLNTLAYLGGHLGIEGVRVAILSGLVLDDDRAELRNRFRLPRTDPDAIDVLLSSDVGCEGLDYEFCDRLVNYDLPWNPMRVEQRIGRIDRFGQQSEKVLIYNLVTPGTVEERVFFRCFERLGVFRDTIGDLEEVLGEVTSELTKTALDPTLSADQQATKARQTADNALRILDEQRRLEDEGHGLLGIDATINSDLEQLRADGRFVTSEDLLHMVTACLSEMYQGKFEPIARRPGVLRLSVRRDGRHDLGQALRHVGGPIRMANELMRWLDSASGDFICTFDQDVALEQRHMPYVTPVHPLSRLGVKHFTADERPLVTQFRARASDVAPGRYLVALYLWEAVANTPDVRLVPFAWNLVVNAPADDAAARIIALVSEGEIDERTDERAATLLTSAVRELEERALDARLAEVEVLRRRNLHLTEARLSSLEGFYSRRLARTQEELERAQDDRIRRMKTSELNRIGRDLESRRADLLARREADIVSRRVAMALVDVRPD